MLERIPSAPPDPILGLTAAFNADDRPHKINLSVGEYRDESGDTPVLEAVRIAEGRVCEALSSKRYLPIDGTPEYGRRVRELVLGAQTEAEAVTVQAPGGTGALRLAADFIARHFPQTTLWLPDPTWANHTQIFTAAGLKTQSYRYYDAATHRLDLEGALGALAGAGAGEVVLLHACCHNPSGADPDGDGWRAIGQQLARCGALPLIDFAYQGFGDGLQEDAAGVQILRGQVPEMLVASSFSKNFGLYQDRVGALTVLTDRAEAAARIQSQLKICVRANFSNPPAHGSAVVTTILDDEGLRAQWLGELTAMRQRIHAMRAALVTGLERHGASRDFSFITRQKGMFSFSGLDAAQVERLREEHALYIVGSGRINVAGITPATLDAVCAAIVAVL